MFYHFFMICCNVYFFGIHCSLILRIYIPPAQADLGCASSGAAPPLSFPSFPTFPLGVCWTSLSLMISFRFSTPLSLYPLDAFCRSVSPFTNSLSCLVNPMQSNFNVFFWFKSFYVYFKISMIFISCSLLLFCAFLLFVHNTCNYFILWI